MKAYTIVVPTNRKPRTRRSFDSASETGVDAGMLPASASGGSGSGGPGTIDARYVANDPNSSLSARSARVGERDLAEGLALRAEADAREQNRKKGRAHQRSAYSKNAQGGPQAAQSNPCNPCNPWIRRSCGT